jgi:hypothetical protein
MKYITILFLILSSSICFADEHNFKFIHIDRNNNISVLKEYKYDNNFNLIEYKTDKGILKFSYSINNTISTITSPDNNILFFEKAYHFKLAGSSANKEAFVVYNILIMIIKVR